MAKAGPAPAPEAAPAAAPVAARAPELSAPPAGPAKVIQWDNEAQGHRDQTPGEAAADAALDGKPQPEAKADKPSDKAEKEPAKAKEGDPPEAEATPPTPAARRAATFDKLAAERRHRELETALQAKQKEHDADRARLTELEGAIKGTNLGKLLALAGINDDDALEALMRKDPKALEGAPKESRKQADPELAELRETVKALTKRLEDQDARNADANVSEAIGLVRETAKDLDIPVTRVTPNGFELVMRTAHELWLASGRSGKALDYVPEAAERAEKHLREKNPDLAALADAAKGGKAEPKTDNVSAKPGGSPGIGRRPAARPDAKAKSVWEGRNMMADRSEVDEQIKRELGLIDKDPLDDE